jgi:hypothetical protein
VDENDLALPVIVEEIEAVIPAVQRLIDAPTPPLGARG